MGTNSLRSVIVKYEDLNSDGGRDELHLQKNVEESAKFKSSGMLTTQSRVPSSNSVFEAVIINQLFTFAGAIVILIMLTEERKL